MQQPKSPLAREVEFIVVSRRIKLLGTAILVGVLLIFVFGLIISDENVNDNLFILNIISFVVSLFTCAIAFPLKGIILKRANEKNFFDTYFNAHITVFALCDFGGLFCITTNLFINTNVVFAAAGMLISCLIIYLSFPKKDDIDIMKEKLGINNQSI